MSTLFFTLAGVAAVLMFLFGLVGCIEMMLPREPSRTKGEDAFRLFDLVILQGAVWSVQTFRRNWRTRHHARKLLYWAFGFLGASILFSGLEVCVEVAKSW